MDIIPAIDLMDGRCVRLTRGDFDTKVIYSDDPVEVASEFEAAGFKRLHMVDLDGAKTGTSANLAVLEAVKRETSLIVDFGGGLRDEQSLNAAFDAGADMVTVGSAAIQQPNLFESWVLRFGADRIILAADVRNGLVAVSGWADTSSRSLESVLERFLGVGLKRVLITDIAKDGMLTGLSVPLYHWVKREYPNLYIIASGGVSTIENIEQVRFVGTDAVVVGKAIYEGKISLEDLVALN